MVLAPMQGAAHAALAYTLYLTLNFSAALPEYDRAISLSPGNPDVQDVYGFFQSALGHHAKKFWRRGQQAAICAANPFADRRPAHRRGRRELASHPLSDLHGHSQLIHR